MTNREAVQALCALAVEIVKSGCECATSDKLCDKHTAIDVIGKYFQERAEPEEVRP